MTFKRLFRLAAFGGAVAAAVAAVRAFTRDSDPLPTPADGPTEPWPPLREATSAAPSSDETAPASEPAPADEVDEVDVESKATSVDDAAVDTDVEAAEEPPAKKVRRARPLRAPWMPPEDDGSCPEGYPLKANDQSMIFHAPGQMSYDRTVPERCYADAEAAIADGYRAAKR